MTLPILDIGDLDAGGEKRAAFLAALRQASRELGFFYLTGHGVAPEFAREVQKVARRFFALSEAEKRAIEMVNSPHFRGYTRLGWERTRGRPDWREQLDVGAERAVIRPGPGVPNWARLQGPNQWPESLPELRPVLLRWQSELTALLIRVLRAFALALDQPEDVFEPIYRDVPNQLVKIIRYPGREAEGDAQGVGAHKDSGIVTAVLQDAQGGLQVETDGGWLDVEPIPGTLVVNMGEALELASDGYLRATVHRVVPPPPGSERLSVAFFLGARLDATIPFLELPPHLAAQAKGPERDPNNPLFRQVGQNYLKGRLRSHPDVARRHYADLLEEFGIDPTEPASAY
ncbi:MAG TPA: 2-oxoglutarate and iron-dependent oxygenase domain-containing protein [Stellaceae bacterium]|nr:2-oxoglutarate and iron-dependent oxygenase domain-containing protein [Stellaceae bacterium]